MHDTDTVSLTEYLSTRLRQLDVEHLFGVPGDFNLRLLEELMELGAPRWVGNANELGAAYAADGYARERGFGALLTTYGVGELSAINGIAGSYAEQVPVLHIGGAPRTQATALGLPLHHTLLDGDGGHFMRAFAEFTVAQAMLTGGTQTGAEIDRVLQAMLDSSLPGYLGIPDDLIDRQIDAAPLQHELRPRASAPLATRQVADRVRGVLQGAEHVVLLAGAGVSRAGCELQLRDLAEAAAIPVATLLDAKGSLSEDHPLSLGIYQGQIGRAEAREAVEHADVLIRVGCRMTDSLSGGFTARLEGATLIDLSLDTAAVDGHPIPGVRMADALAAVRTALGERIARTTRVRGTRAERTVAAPADPAAPLTQAVLWKTIAELLPADATVLADAGTSFYGIGAERLHDDTEMIGQPVWSSIGYCLPATLGVQLGRPERRAVLLTGDGAAQMTVQELGTIAREGLHPIVVLIDNDGYTIERVIRGPESAYNDITRWDWRQVIEGLTAGSHSLAALHAATRGELHDALLQARAMEDKLVLVHVRVDRHDAPRALEAMMGAIAASGK